VQQEARIGIHMSGILRNETEDANLNKVEYPSNIPKAIQYQF